MMVCATCKMNLPTEFTNPYNTQGARVCRSPVYGVDAETGPGPPAPPTYRLQQPDLIQGCLCVMLGTLNHFHRHELLSPKTGQFRLSHPTFACQLRSVVTEDTRTVSTEERHTTARLSGQKSGRVTSDTGRLLSKCPPSDYEDS